VVGRPPRPRRLTEATIAKRDKYAAEFLPYVEKVARRLARRLPAHVEITDLISAGVTGLMEAATAYDPALNDRFENFASPRIRGAMLDELRDLDPLSRDMRALSNKLRAAARRLEHQLGRRPEQDEIAAWLGISLEKLYKQQAHHLAGSSVVGFDDVSPDLLEHVEDKKALDPFEVAARVEAIERIAAIFGTLPLVQKQVLTMYYVDHLDLKEVGAAIGRTESRACQILGMAIKEIRSRV
jgi:RNA polymerase sigma factor for flagellar operon FliA